MLIIGIVHGEAILRGSLWLLTFVNKRFLPRYAAHKVGQQATDFVNDHVIARVADVSPVKLKVEFIEGTDDARLTEQGAIFVRIRDERDQRRNTLTALAVTIPKLFYPHARPYLTPRFVHGVDLQFLRNLARMLGSHAEQVFSTDFLAPAQHGDKGLEEIIRKLFQIERGGIFEAILIQELIHVSDHATIEPPSADLQDETRQFVDWLERLAKRAPRDESVPVEFYGKTFRVGVILTSKTITQEKGTLPYEKAMRVYMARGAESIYILGVRPGQHRFAREIATECAKDRRVELRKITAIDVHREGETKNVPLVLFRPNKLYAPMRTFHEQVEVFGLSPGKTVRGRIHEVSERKVRVEVQRLEAEMNPRDMAWGFTGDPRLLFRTEGVADLKILGLDEDLGIIRLGRKQLLQNPWTSGVVPNVGEELQAEVFAVTDDSVLVFFPEIVLERADASPATVVVTDENETEELDWERLDRGVTDQADGIISSPDRLFARLPRTEWSWLGSSAGDQIAPRPGDLVRVRVISRERSSDAIVVSKREAEGTDSAWKRARLKYAQGQVVRAAVVRVEPEGLVMKLEDGVFGRIADYKITKLGHELADFRNTVIAGQQFDVLIERARDGRQSFVLDLARGHTRSSTGRK